MKGSMWKSETVSHDIFYIRFDKSFEIIELCVTLCSSMGHTHTHTYIYIYMYVCMYVCMIECIYLLGIETLA